ncbi:MAG: glycoside hydrolase family 127 protein [Spirochaetaceae bacterium]|nr:glycoside hydrolase family 127 protein [Spirochaetaceae bacterium]
MKVQTQIDQKAFEPNEGFIKNFQKLIKNTVIPYQYEVLNDTSADNTEKSHVIQNFINAGNVLAGKGSGDGFYGMVFQDSDAAKWIEAAAYALALFPDKKLEKNVDNLIDIIAAAQDKDGYLDTYFTVKDNDKRFQNLHDAHELYCSGHMMEAACAYYEATGKSKLLDVMLKNAECIYNTFVKGDDFKRSAYPGHPEIELALMKMYRTTGDKRCFELAEHFVNVRGVDTKYYEKEMERRDWNVWGGESIDNAYHQSDMPVREQKDAKGHAVRAVYLYTAMADLAGTINDAELQAACRRLWESITKRQMYVTGGIGSTVLGEAFTVDYDLPPDTAYCETCASIGLIFFASRMLENDLNSEYADIMEKAFYNTVLGGMQQDGKRFFYVNPLEVVPGIAEKAQTHRHVLPERPTWYACACCPPNVARLVSSFGKYAYGENKTTLFCHLYAAGTVKTENGMRVRCETAYPYGFTVSYTVEECAENSTLAVRIPGWSRIWEVSKNGAPLLGEDSADGQTMDNVALKGGYAHITVKKGDKVNLVLDKRPYFVYPSQKIPDLCGQAAVCMGPLVFCAEGKDNGDDVLSLMLNTEKPVEVSLNKNSAMLAVSGFRIKGTDDLYSDQKPEAIPQTIWMIPYYLWGNRGVNQMKVWFPYR